MEDKKIYEVHSLYHIDFRDHVRLRPKMYFEDCFKENNLNSLVFGALCHAIDVYFDNNYNKIIINIAENSFNLKYNSGMSLENSSDLSKAECIMTKIGACSNEKKHLEVGDEFCRLGMAIINVAMQRCELNTIYNKQKGHFIFENGVTIINEIASTDIFENSTNISFQTDKEIFDDLKFEFNDLQLKLNSLKEKFPKLEIELHKL